VVLLLLGMAFLEVGAQLAVGGVQALAVATGVSAFALGVVLFGIDTESLGSTVVAAGRGETALGAGVAFGTIVFTFGAAFGVALLLSRRPVAAPAPAKVLAPAIGLVGVTLTVTDLVVTRAEGLALVLLYVAYLSSVIVGARHERAAPIAGGSDDAAGGTSGRGRLGWALARTAVGLVALYGGAWLMVEGGLRVLRLSDLTAGFVGAALVGVLASLDEVVLEMMAVRRGSDGLATGNLLGTLAGFTMLAPGVAAIVHPLTLDGAVSATLIAAAILYVVVAVTFLLRGRAGRLLGAFLLVGFAGWAIAAVRL